MEKQEKRLVTFHMSGLEFTAISRLQKIVYDKGVVLVGGGTIVKFSLTSNDDNGDDFPFYKKHFEAIQKIRDNEVHGGRVSLNMTWNGYAAILRISDAFKNISSKSEIYLELEPWVVTELKNMSY